MFHQHLSRELRVLIGIDIYWRRSFKGAQARNVYVEIQFIDSFLQLLMVHAFISTRFEREHVKPAWERSVCRLAWCPVGMWCWNALLLFGFTVTLYFSWATWPRSQPTAMPNIFGIWTTWKSLAAPSAVPNAKCLLRRKSKGLLVTYIGLKVEKTRKHNSIRIWGAVKEARMMSTMMVCWQQPST